MPGLYKSLVLPSVIADCDGTSIATSLRLCVYLISSITGIKMARPYSDSRGIILEKPSLNYVAYI